MKPWYNQNDCENLAAYHAYYPVPAAAMLWCKVPPGEVQDELNRSSPHPSIRGVFTHPYIPCFQVRCKIIHDAIVSGALQASRENGVVTDEHIAPERRHVSREQLKAWIAKEHPADKPAFLFDEIERNTHSAISPDVLRALQAERDALRAELEKTKALATKTVGEMDAMRGERDSLRAMVDRMSAETLEPTGKSKNSMLRIIGGLAMAGFGLQIHGRLDGLSDVVADLAEKGVLVDDGTLRDRLREAAKLIEAPDGK